MSIWHLFGSVPLRWFFTLLAVLLVRKTLKDNILNALHLVSIPTYTVYWLNDTRSHNLLNPSLTSSHIIAQQLNQGRLCNRKSWIFSRRISFDIHPNHKSLIWSSFIQQYHSPFKAMNWGGTITFNPLLTFLLKAQCSSALQLAVPKEEL